jgi:eukaryotic-like serine/threonine-protein kinase
VSDEEDLRATETRAFAVTVVDTGGGPAGREAIDDDPSDDIPLPTVDDIVGVHYRLVRLLGEGMFGKVYAAQRIDVPEHQVALKILKRSLYTGRNVERELVMLATVGHPNVVQLKDHGTTGDYVWLTMPVYEGETLSERLGRGVLGLRDAHDIFLSIARGIEALHAAGLRHQDIKPDNIFLAMFAGRMHPILLDLGVAAEKEATFVAGTALYAAPEQLLAFTGVPGALPLTEKMDTYCIAATLLMSLVGKQYFPGDRARTRDEIAEAHEVRATEPIHPDAMPELVGRARTMVSDAFRLWLATDPADRPSMSSFAEQLDVLLEPERVATRAEERRRARQKANLTRVSLAAAGLGLLGIAGAGILFSKRETIRLAGDLQAARDKGAESFERLDTCIASHNLSSERAATCERQRTTEQEEFQETLARIERSGGGNEAAAAREIQEVRASYQARLHTCEEDAKSAAATHEAEKTRLRTDLEDLEVRHRERVSDMELVIESRAIEVESLTAQRDACDVARATCITERNACMNGGDSIYDGPAAPKPAPPPAMPTDL